MTTSVKLMSLPSVSAAVLLASTAAAIVAWQNGTALRAAGSAQPLDVEQERGVLTHVVEAPALAGEVREYYAGRLRGGGEELHALLVVTQNGSAPKTYQLTEYETDFGKPPKRTVSSGNLTIGATPTAAGEIVYRLDGAASPKQSRIFLKSYDKLYVPKDPGNPGAGASANSLALAAAAAKGRVELRAGFEEWLLKLRLRLRIGETLVVHLDQPPGTSYALKSGTLGTALQHAGSSNEKGSEGAYDYQLFTFKAVARGSTELAFDFFISPDKQLGDPFKASITVE
jgi:hypothetical protein